MMEERRVVVNGLLVNYRVFGASEAQKSLLILHGWPSSSEKWMPTAELLSQNRKVVVPDLPGFGKSQEPPISWSLDTYVGWLNEFTELVPELKRGFYLLGHSFGGALACKFTINYTQKVEKLFLAAAACIRTKTISKNALKKIAKLGKLITWVPQYDVIRKAFYKFIVRRSDYLNVSENMKETYLRVIADDLSQKINFIKVPVIIIWGDKDTLTPPEDAEFMKEKIPGSKLILMQGVGHALQVQQPEVLAQNISTNF